MLRARTDIGKTFQLSSRTSENKLEIEIHKETSEYTILTIEKYIKRQGSKKLRKS